jgi:hypothetical protein
MGDIYRALDWSLADEWAEKTQEGADIPLTAEDLKASRCEMIHKAIYGHEEQKVVDAARFWLNHFGVWDDLIAYMKKHT